MPANAALIDTGPIVAIFSENDRYHQMCKEAFRQLPPKVYTCWPVITETVYLLGNYSTGVARLFDLLRKGTLEIIPLSIADLSAIEAILSKYADQDFQLADATLMYLAEREGYLQVLTTDRRDFSLFRTNQGESLTLLPHLE